MGTTDAIILIVALALALLGFLVGFASTLRFFTHGVFGWIISVFMCATLGGMVQGAAPVQNWLAELNASMGGFLQTIHAATIVFYFVFFLVLQLVRVLVVRLVAGIFSSPAAPVRFINRILGMLLMVGAVFLLVLLVLAIIAVFGNTQGAMDLVAKMDGTFLGTLYEHNPIRFVPKP